MFATSAARLGISPYALFLIRQKGSESLKGLKAVERAQKVAAAYKALSATDRAQLAAEAKKVAPNPAKTRSAYHRYLRVNKLNNRTVGLKWSLLSEEQQAKFADAVKKRGNAKKVASCGWNQFVKKNKAQFAGLSTKAAGAKLKELAAQWKAQKAAGKK